jgi:periplasmic protein TonB
MVHFCGEWTIRCATIVSLTWLIVVSEAPPAAALPMLTPLSEIDSQQHPPSDGGCSKPASGSETVVSGPNPDASGKYHVGDGVSVPRLVFAPSPEFTDKASRKNIAGRVVVSLTVDVAGNPQNVCLSRSLAEDVSKKLRSIALAMDDRVIEAVKQYRFEPAQFRGKPVPVETTIGIQFGVYGPP